MNGFSLRLIFVIIFFLISFHVSHSQSFTPLTPTRADSLRGFLSENRQSFDVKFYALDILIDTNHKSINGIVDIYFEVLKPLDSLQLDLFKNMEIEKIESSTGDELKFSRELNTFYVNLGKQLPQEKLSHIRIHYYGKPRIAPMAPWDGGFVWTYDKNGDLWISTAVQGLGASSWYPCKDHQSDKPDSVSIRVTVPDGFQNISNGRLRSVEEVSNGVTYEWFVSNPINTYNVCLNIGKFDHFEDVYINADSDTLTLDYYVKSYNLAKAIPHFEQVTPMLECFEEKFGKYPFYEDGYKIVETPFAGMEHQSAIAYGNNFENGYRGVSASEYGKEFDYILIHETAHEWWGNNITSNDIADMWIHESFGTYAETVYVECMFGYDAAITYINDHKSLIENKRPILGIFGVNKRGSLDMYRKGMLMLNTLRHVIDDDNLWWDILRGLIEEFRQSSVDGADVISYISKKSGMSLDNFFQQYLEFPSLPDLILEKIQNGDDTILKFHWKADVVNFTMPVRLLVKDEVVKIFPSTNEQEIILLNTSPENIIVDTSTVYIKVNGK